MIAQPDNSSRPSPGSCCRHRVGLSARDEQRLKARLRRAAPSEPWVEAQIKTADDVDQDGSELLYRYHDPHVFPPGGARTAMRRCPLCGIFMPPNAFEHDACLDHADHRGWGPSPSAAAIRALQMFNIRLECLELLPEDALSLRKEIKNFPRGPKMKMRAQLANRP